MEEFSKAPLLERLRIELDKEGKEKLVYYIKDQKRRIDQDRQPWIDRQTSYLDQYDNFTSWIRKNAPWDDASNIHLPFTSIMVKSYKSRLYNIFSSEDVWNITGVESTDAKTALAYKKLFRWYLYGYINEYRGIQGLVDEICMDVATVGWAVVFKDYFLKQQKIVTIEENIDFQKEMEAASELIEDNQKIQVAQFKEIQKVVTTYEGTRLRTIPYESILFPNYINESSNLNEPPLVWISIAMSESELRLGVAQGRFDSDAVERIIKSGPSSSKSTSEGDYIKQKKGAMSGFDANQEITRPETYPIGYAFVSYDLDDDGINEELMVTMHENGEILCLKYLEKARRPLYKFDCFTKPRQAYARGVPEAVYSIQSQLDINYNMRNDYLALQTAPFGTYRSTSSLKNEPIEIKPGRFIPTDETTDLRVVTFPASATVLQGEENILWNYGQQQVSVSSVSQGFMSGAVGPQRSTSGVNALMSNLEKEFRPVVDSFGRGFKVMLQDIFSDMFLLPTETKQRVLGPEFQSVEILNSSDSIQDHAKRFDLVMNVANLANSEEVRRNNAFMLYQTLSGSQIAQTMGIVTPRGLYNSLNNWIETFDYLNPSDYIEAPQGMEKSVNLNQEIQFIMQGVIPPMSMQDDHAKKIEELKMFAQTPVYQEAKAIGRAVSNVDDVMMKTIEKHEELLALSAPKGLPNVTGAQYQEPNAVFANRAPQQGGMTNGTTSRDQAIQAGGAGNQRGSEQALQDEGMGEPA